MTESVADLRYAVRALRQAPLFTAAVVATLAVGIAANVAIFTVVNAALLAPLPWADPGSLVVIWETHAGDGGPYGGSGRTTVAPANYLDWRERAESLEDLAAFNVWQPTLRGDAGSTRVEASLVTPDFFDVLGVEPLLGSGLGPEHGVPGGDRVVVLAHGLWQGRYGGDPGVLGRAVRIDGESYEVVGVMPAGFRQPEPSGSGSPALWAPLTLAEPARNSRWLRTLGRLAPGVSPETAGRELRAIAAALAAEYPDSNDGYGAEVVPLRRQLAGETERPLLLLLGAAAFLLLIVCTNVANLVLARGQRRRRETAIRASLGAGRGRLVRQVMSESGLLTVAGAVVGLGLVLAAGGAVKEIQARLYPAIPELVLDLRVLAFTGALAGATALLFGLVPALQLSRADLGRVMRESSAGAGESGRMRRGRDALVVTEVALATMLLIGAGLLTRSYVQLRSVSPGFDPAGVLTLSVSPSVTDDAAVTVAFYDRLLADVRGLPGVVDADVISDLPFTSANYGTGYRPEGTPELPDARQPTAEYHLVGPRHFSTLGIPLLAGRGFEPGDDAAAPFVVVVDRTLAEERWSGAADAVGRGIEVVGAPATIVGVSGAILDDGFAAEPEPRVYISYRQRTFIPYLHLLVRTDPGDGGAIRGATPEGLVSQVRSMVARLDPGAPVADARLLEDLMAGTISSRRLGAGLLGLFTGLALLLACLGIYAVLAYGVAQRGREIAIRTALGARRGQVVGMVLGRSLALAGAGVVAGLAGGLLLGRSLDAFLFEVSGTDPASFVLAPAALLAAALLAGLAPARRAARLDPMRILR